VIISMILINIFLSEVSTCTLILLQEFRGNIVQ
jgi:hypothetical protein